MVAVSPGTTLTSTVAPRQVKTAAGTAFGILGAISFCHLLNDMLQSVIPAVYPLLKTSYHLDFGRIGLITLTIQLTASLLQPLVGLYNDYRAMPYSLPVGMGFTLTGLVLLSRAPTYGMVLVSVALIGVGSSVFHPESSRVARMASGGQHGLAQSLFQVGGNAGTSLGPLLAAFIVLPLGQRSIAWFALAALTAMLVLTHVAHWHQGRRSAEKIVKPRPAERSIPLSPRKVATALSILVALIFSKFFYMVSLNTFYIFYLMNKFHLPVRSAQMYLFIFLGAVAAGTIIGGPVGDRIGRKYVIWWSILGVLPFTLLLPHANLFWTGILTVIIGLVLSSAFSAILVYAQELLPGKVGMVSGLFFGLAFGTAGIGAALLGKIADTSGIATVYQICAFLPAIGLLTAFLPNIEPARARALRQAK